jgi:hypothetical protein
MGDAGGTDLYIRHVDGRGAARLAVDNADRPVWSSRGGFARVRDRKVYVSAADGARERLVTAGIDPDWSANGSAWCWCARPARCGSTEDST